MPRVAMTCRMQRVKATRSRPIRRLHQARARMSSLRRWRRLPRMCTSRTVCRSLCFTRRARLSCGTLVSGSRNTRCQEHKPGSTLSDSKFCWARKVPMVADFWVRSNDSPIRLAPTSFKSPSTPTTAVSQEGHCRRTRSFTRRQAGAASAECGVCPTAS